LRVSRLSLHDALPISQGAGQALLRLWATPTCSALMRRDAQGRARGAVLTAAERIVIGTRTRGGSRYGRARLPEGKRRSARAAARSEEHTSELQSLTNL